MLLFVIFSLTLAQITVPLRSSAPSPSLNFLSHKKFVQGELTTSVKNYFNLQYYADFQIGSPGQNVSLILDTGSSWTWVPMKDCKCHSSSNQYDPKLSSSYEPSEDDAVLLYGQGKVKGKIARETLTLSKISAKQQDFVLATSDEELEGLISDGLLGLGFKELCDFYPTFIDNLKEQGAINNSVFALYLNNKNFINSPQSALTLGGFDESYADGPGEEINILKDRGFWLTICDGIKVGDQRFDQKRLALFDIGSSFLHGPQKEVGEIFKRISQATSCSYDKEGYYACLCEKKDFSRFPTLEFFMSNKSFIVNPESYLFYENQTCYVFISGMKSNYWLFGQVFLREFYTVYDMDNYKVTLFKAIRKEKESSITQQTAVFLATGTVLGLFICWRLFRGKSEGRYQDMYASLQ